MELKPGYKQTEVGVIPEEWDVVLLDSVSRRASGHTPDKAHPEYWGGDIKWVSLADSHRLDDLYINETTATITTKGIANSSANILPAGCCIVSRDAGVGKSAVLAEKMAVSQHFMAWHCGPRLNNHYLYFLLQAMKPELERIAIGNTIKTIGLPYFKSLRVPLPSIAEQESIARALLDVDQLIRDLAACITKKRNIKQAAMQELLTGKRRLPGFEGEWGVKKLGEIAEVTMGQSPSSYNYNKQARGLPLIQGNADIKNRETAPRTFTTQITKRGFNGDILMTVRAPVGEVSKANIDVCLGRGVCAIRFPNNFLYHFLVFLEPAWAKHSKGSTFDSVNGDDIKAVDIHLPCESSEQNAIADVLSEMDAELAALEARRDKTRELKQGMMQELLTGRIRLQ
jgi:type I restriction enzyme S subunit